MRERTNAAPERGLASLAGHTPCLCLCLQHTDSMKKVNVVEKKGGNSKFAVLYCALLYGLPVHDGNGAF